METHLYKYYQSTANASWWALFERPFKPLKAFQSTLKAFQSIFTFFSTALGICSTFSAYHTYQIPRNASYHCQVPSLPEMGTCNIGCSISGTTQVVFSAQYKIPQFFNKFKIQNTESWVRLAAFRYFEPFERPFKAF